jgi:hypothetical protein
VTQRGTNLKKRYIRKYEAIYMPMGAPESISIAMPPAIITGMHAPKE